MSKQEFDLVENELHRGGKFLCYVDPDADLGTEAGRKMLNDAGLGLVRLIACANACEGITDPSVVPELLILLKECLDEEEVANLHNQGALLPTTVCRIREAIARAEGK